MAPRTERYGEVGDLGMTRLIRARAGLEDAARAFAKEETEANREALREWSVELVRAESARAAALATGYSSEYTPPDPKMLNETERRLAQRGKKLEAVVHYRNRVGSSYLEAQEAVDAWLHEVRLA